MPMSPDFYSRLADAVFQFISRDIAQLRNDISAGEPIHALALYYDADRQLFLKMETSSAWKRRRAHVTYVVTSNSERYPNRLSEDALIAEIHAGRIGAEARMRVGGFTKSYRAADLYPAEFGRDAVPVVDPAYKCSFGDFEWVRYGLLEENSHWTALESLLDEYWDWYLSRDDLPTDDDDINVADYGDVPESERNAEGFFFHVEQFDEHFSGALLDAFRRCEKEVRALPLSDDFVAFVVFDDSQIRQERIAFGSMA